MQYLDLEGTVVYTSNDGDTTKIFPALEWLAAMCSHIPNQGEQMVRFYGFYSNISRGKRQKEGLDDAVPCILKSQGDEKTFRRNWELQTQFLSEEKHGDSVLVHPVAAEDRQGTADGERWLAVAAKTIHRARRPPLFRKLETPGIGRSRDLPDPAKTVLPVLYDLVDAGNDQNFFRSEDHGSHTVPPAVHVDQFALLRNCVSPDDKHIGSEDLPLQCDPPLQVRFRPGVEQPTVYFFQGANDTRLPQRQGVSQTDHRPFGYVGQDLRYRFSGGREVKPIDEVLFQVSDDLFSPFFMQPLLFVH